jgi:3-deoxy-D-manno-octulosonic-acid transferase
LIYSLLTAAGMILLSPYFLIRGLIRGKNLSNIPERLGLKCPPELQKIDDVEAKSIWIHAVSVGEVLAVLPLAKQLKDRYPQRRLIISTTTATGQQLAQERMQFANAIFYFPLDWSGPVRRALKATQAAIVIIVETEIWSS